MVKLYSIITGLLFAVGSASAADTAGYEWWLDSDLSTLQTGQISNGRIELPLDLPALGKGIHYFNCRLKNSDGGYGSIYRQVFYNFEDSTKNRAVAYEYWLDNSNENKVSGLLNGSANSFMVDLPGMKEGVHYFNYRLRTSEGVWGSVYRKPFFKLGDQSQSQAVRYEYWFDNQYNLKKTGSLSAGATIFNIDLSEMRPGGHFFNCRVEASDGRIGSIYRKYFLVMPESQLAVGYEYWLDNDYAARKSGVVEGRILNFDMDLSDMDKKHPVHFFNLRLKDAAGKWGSVYRKAIVNPDPTDFGKILGYREYLNTEYLGYKALPNGVDGGYSFSVDLPEGIGTSLKDHELVFDGDLISVSWEDKFEYILQLDSERGWTPPAIWEFESSHNFSAIAEEMDVNSIKNFGNPKKNEFAAIKFRSSGKSLYMRTDKGIALDIYKDGNKVKQLEFTELTEMQTLLLAEGEYYGILHDAEENQGGEFSFSLMDRLEGLHAPEISYTGRYLTLSAEEGAEIYYTLDGTDPKEGRRYEGVVDPAGLGEVRAVTVKDGYFDSEVAGFEIRVYADEEKAITSAPGILAEGFSWNPDLIGEIERYKVSGYLNEEDYAFIRSMSNLNHLDLGEASSEFIPDEALSGLDLVSISMPEAIVGYGRGIFGENGGLCAIRWNSELPIEARMVEGIENPNLLLYLTPGAAVSDDSEIMNIIRDGEAEVIQLQDRYPFYAPESFSAGSISYSRYFSKATEIGETAGWETIALPFDVSEIRDSRGEIMPFAKEDTESRPFWLYKPSVTGWERTDRIEAYEPYLISMPNNPKYIEEFNITGDVEFLAYNSFVQATPEVPAFPYRNGSMYPYYSILDYNLNPWVINDEWYEGNAPGSRFVNGLRDVRPFEGYLTYESSMLSIPVFDESELEKLGVDTGLRIWKEQGKVCVYSPVRQKLTICDTLGRVIRVIEVAAGETALIDDLVPGLYIIGNQKIRL